MQFSNERIKSLQTLLRDVLGLEYTDEQAQEAGLAIVRFIATKALRERALNKSGEKTYARQQHTN